MEERVPLRDLGRTAFLGFSYRMQPAQARVLSELLHADDGAGHPPFIVDGSLRPAGGPCVEFVPVPTLPPDPEPRRRHDAEPHWQGGGTPEQSSRQSWSGMKNLLQKAGAL